MIVKITQSDLNNALQVVQKGISSKTLLPILNGILFTIENNSFSFYATDLELSIKYKIPIKSDVNFSTVLPGRLITDIIKNLSDGVIEMEFNKENNKVRIQSNKALFEVNTMPAEDFPSFPEIESEKSITINVKLFSEAIKQVIKSASKDETRPVLCGVYLSVENGKMTLVATDSYRLALCEINLDNYNSDDFQVIIPSKSLDEIVKVCSENDIEFGLSKNQIYFNTTNTSIISRLIEGKFPSYQQLLPENYEVRVIIKKEEFINSLKRVSLLSQGNPLVNIRLNKDENNRGQVILRVISSDIGFAEEVLDAEIEGENMEIVFNAQYLIDGINSINDENVCLELISPIKPGILKPKSKSNFLYLVMPVRVG